MPTPLAHNPILSASHNGGFPFPPLNNNNSNAIEVPPPPPVLPWPSGPPMRSLDYATLVTPGDVHKELEKTIGELGEWLKVVDLGFQRLLGDDS